MWKYLLTIQNKIDILKPRRNHHHHPLSHFRCGRSDIKQKLRRYLTRQLVAIIVGGARNFSIIKNLVPCTSNSHYSRLIEDNCKQNNYRPENVDYRRGLSRRGPRSEAIITDHFGRPVCYTL